ncbi:uncharacterized protein RHO25_011059 [Cercospora beticola]|uniref:Ubiquitin-like protease family profile domain-containing protein n=1 Tax=Cercospora beticola TaxID=122368 RepID=A0ABZ0P3H2_CERBT|nr:hypothetical protein RHO25_011059 [Cercospora beticola]
MDMAFAGFQRGIAWNKRHHAQRNAQWAYFEVQSPNERTSPDRSVRMPPLLEEVTPSSPPQSGKRRRSEEGDSPGRSRKSSRNSSSAQSLTPNYQQTPKDATRIFVPKYDPGEDWNPRPPARVQHEKMGAPHRPAYGFQPRNTLHQQSVQSGNKRQRSLTQQRLPEPSFKPFTAGGSSRPQPLPLSKSSGSNVVKPLDVDEVVDDELESQRPPTKKSRLDSDLVDLTDDYSQGVAVPAKQGIHRSGSHGSAAGSSSRSKKKLRGGGDAFGNNELYLADMEGGNLHSNSRRALPGMRASTAASQSQAQAGRSYADHDHKTNGTAQSPVDVDADDSQSAIRDTAGEMLERDLWKGVAEAGNAYKRNRQKTQQGSAYNKDDVDNVFESVGYLKPSIVKARPVATAAPRRSIPQPQVAHVNHDFERGTPGPRIARERQPADVRGRFVRDAIQSDDGDRPVETIRMHNQAQPRQPTLPSRPQPREHSPDVLGGETTVGSQKSRSASPKKAAEVPRPEPAGSAYASPKAQTYNSSLKPTNFTRAADQKPAVPKKVDADIWKLGEDDGDVGRPQITTFICRGFAMQATGYALIWDHTNERFLLADESGTLVFSPWRKEPVQICKFAAAHGFISHPSSTKAILKGSSDWMSTGHILLHFHTLEGKNSVFEKLRDEFGVEFVDVDVDRLGSMFTNLGNKEIGGYLKLRDQAEARANQAQADDDVIIYDTEQPSSAVEQTSRREKLVSKMKRETLSEVLRAQETQQNGARQPLSRLVGTDSQQFVKEPTRRSTRQSKPPPQYREPSPELVKWTVQNGLPKWTKSVVYPQVGTRRVTVDVGDLEHLDAGEFLNDNIVNYALRHIEETMSPAHKERVHFFNTFFFSSLTTKNGKKDFNYDAVKKWTKNADLLSKPYIVVPINLDLHWFVAIIYNLPALRRRMVDTDDEPSTEDAVDLCSESEATPAKPEEPHSKLEQMSLSDNAEGRVGDCPAQEDEALDGTVPTAVETARSQPTIKGKKGRKKRVAPVRKFNPEQPMIISLDSFGLARTNELRVIKKYVIEEAREKRQMAVAMDDLQGVNAKGIPQQDNFYDCGVYLIGYMKEFARDPDRFVKKILGRQIDENDFKEFNTTALRDEIRETLIKYGDEQDAQYKKDKLARASARKNGQTPQVVKTPSGAPTSAQATATRADTSAPPTSSQPARGSPSAEKVGRQVVPVQQQPPSASKGTTPSSRKVAPSPRKSPRKEPPDEGDADENDDELEVDAPQPLRKSHTGFNEQARSSPVAGPDEKKDQEDEHEMLDTADPSAGDSRGPRSATPPKRPAPVHNAHLSPLSSLEQDNRSSRTRSPGLVSTISAGVINDMVSKTDSAARDRVGQDGVEDDETDIESVSDDSERVPQRTVVIDIGDEGEPDPLGKSMLDEDTFEGFPDNTGNDGAEIPDSQPDALQSQVGQ